MNRLFGSNSEKTYYTLEEVAKHNTESDAWIVINDKVYNVTDWLEKHPGGSVIIMKEVGGISEGFDIIRHSVRAKKLLKNYLIGYLKKGSN